MEIYNLNHVQFTELMKPLFTFRTPLWKRCIDIFGAIFALILFSPCFLIIAVMIKVVSPGPVIFKQKRVGLGGEFFNIFKFRTMHENIDTSKHKSYLSKLISANKNDSADSQPMTKIEDTAQIIPGAGILRKSCLDELPQLINVLRGEMSLVGPRPAIPYEVQEYAAWHHGRLDCLPGMTGLWQVSGKNLLSFEEMVRLDILYARNISFLSDIKILFKTPFAIFSFLK